MNHSSYHEPAREFPGFGLWMELERLGQEAPIRAEHPEWSIPGRSSGAHECYNL